MATYSIIPAWEIPWTEEPGGLQSMGLQELDTTERLNQDHLIGSPWYYHNHKYVIAGPQITWQL